VNPEIRQVGSKTIKVYMKLTRNEGDCPVMVNKRDNRTRSDNDTIGAETKIIFILRGLFRSDLPASMDPAAERISQEPRNTPEISS
jgi:hypothetical protein